MKQEIVRIVLQSLIRKFPEAVGITIADKRKIIHVECKENENLPFVVGDIVSQEELTNQALLDGVEVKGITTCEGTSYYAVSMPYIEKGSVTGVVTVFYTRNPVVPPVTYLTIKMLDRWVPLHFKEVIFMEAQNRKTHIVSQTHRGTHRNNLTELEKILPKDIFFRCHRSYIINIHQIKEIHPDSHSTFILIMIDQSRVPVSQNYAKEIRSRFGF